MSNGNNKKLTVCWVKEVKDEEIDQITDRVIKWSWDSEYIRTARTDSGLLIDFQGIPLNKSEMQELTKILSKKIRLLHDSAICHEPWWVVWRNIPD